VHDRVEVEWRGANAAATLRQLAGVSRELPLTFTAEEGLAVALTDDRCDRHWCAETQQTWGIVPGEHWGRLQIIAVQRAWELDRHCEKPAEQDNRGCPAPATPAAAESEGGLVTRLVQRGEAFLKPRPEPLGEPSSLAQRSRAAEAVFTAALQIDPTSHAAMYGRAIALDRQGRWEDAQSQFEALSLNPLPETGKSMGEMQALVSLRIKAMQGLVRCVGRRGVAKSKRDETSFLERTSALYSPGYGTEHMALVVHAAVRFIRPETVLEIGVGYTTPFILRALEDNEADVVCNYFVITL